MTADRETIIGIDLGTTFSLVAIADQRGPRVLPDENGEARLPSVIGLVPGPDGRPTVTVGWQARAHAVENPQSTVYSVKRLIGKSPAELASEIPLLAYAVQPGPRDTLQVEIAGRRYSPEEISSVILRELKARAERHLGRPVRKAVITVPAYFDDAQRQATRDAGQAAGLEVVRIINEPTAAALAYGIGLRSVGTASASEGATPTRGVGVGSQGAPAGMSAQAPRDRVSLPMPHCHDNQADGSASPGFSAALPFGSSTEPLPDGQGSEGHPGCPSQTVLVFDLGGGTFDVSILRIEDGVFQVLATAGDTHLGGDDYDRTITTLVQSEIRTQFGLDVDSPATRQALRTLSEDVKVRLTTAESAGVELDLGAGRVYQRRLTRAEFESLTAPLTQRCITLCRRALADAKLTPAQIEEFVLVGGSTRMPVVRAAVAELAGKPPYTALNPDEVVALGAAMQASVLAGADLDLLLLDVTPLSLGIETMGGAVGKLILRNAAIPCRAVEQFTTFVDGQTAIQVNVLQGERELARDCRLLGQFTLAGLPPMPAGIPKVAVEFLIDANGILNVSAREERSGRAASIQIVPSHGLTREEVARIERESIAFAREDLAAHRRIDLVNQIAFDTHKTEQMLAHVIRDLPNELPEPEREAIRARIAALRELARTCEDLDQLHRELDAFGKSTVRLAELGIRAALK